MTLEELVNLNIRDNYVTDGVHVYCIEDTFKIIPDLIEFTFTDIKSGVMNNLIVFKLRTKYILQNPMKSRFLYNLSIKPKKEESKMKTEFNMPAQTIKPNTYPKFMLHKSKEYVALFFNPSCAVVVSSTSPVYKINFFDQHFIMKDFTPVEGCSVTFSDKD